MAGPGNPTTEQQIILDADGRPVLSVMQTIEKQLKTIRGQVDAIQNSSHKSVKDFNTALSVTVNQLRDAMAQMKTLAQAPNTAGGSIQSINANRGLAAQTKQATDYARSLDMARNSAEALRGKMNDLNREIAKRGTEGQTATVAQRDRLALYEKQLAALKALDAQQERNERRIARTKGGDLSAERKAVEDARARLEAAALDPKRSGLVREIKAAQQAQDALTEAVNRTRTAQAGLERVNRAAGGALIPREVRTQASAVGAVTARTGYMFDQRQAEERLARATDATRAADTQALALANQRLRVAEKLVAQEEALAQKAARAAEQIAKADAARIERLRVAAEMQARADARVGGRSSRETAVGEIAKLRTIAELEAARTANDARKATLRASLLTASTAEQRVIHQQLEIEKAIGQQIRANTSDIKRQEAERNRAAAASAPPAAPAPGRGPSILPAGGLGTVLARTAAYGGAAAAIYGTINLFKTGIGFSIELEDEMKKLQAISNSTDMEMQGLRRTILDVGEATRYSLVELAKISQTLAQAGISANQMGSVLKSVTTLATASGSSPDEAVQLVTSALGSFQLQGSEAARVADLMTTALNRTKLTVAQTGQAIQYVGATAFEQNISLEQMLATIGAVAQAGIKSGSTIGTGFRQFLVDLQSPSEKLTAQLSALKLSASDVDVEVRGLPAVLTTLKEAGFGAGQAYAGLETRAAAFYLVAKNNIDIMSQLQLGFANSGAAALAQERAMDSLSAQWQRFKNILGEGFSDFMEGPLRDLKGILGALSDRLIEMEEESNRLAKLNAEGKAAWYEKDLMPSAKEAITTLTGVPEEFYLLLKKGLHLEDAGREIDSLGEKWMRYERNVADASSRTDVFTASLNEATQKVDDQRTKIESLDKEILKLIVQKETLRNNEVLTGAETVTLTSRFEGLAVYLKNTGNRFDDLTQAANRYRDAQLGLLNSDLLGQQAALGASNVDAIQRGRSIRGQLLADKGLMSRMGEKGRNAINSPMTGSNQAILSDMAAVLSRSGTKEDLARSKLLYQLSGFVSTVATNTTTMTANTLAIKDNDLSRTGYGAQLKETIDKITAGITQLGSARGKDASKIAGSANAGLNWMESTLNARIADKSRGPDQQAYFLRAKDLIPGLRAQISAAVTAAVPKAVTPKATPVEKTRMITAGDILRIAQGVAPGINPNGRERSSRARQAELKAMGVTPAGPDQSYHTRTDGVAKDLPGNWGRQAGQALAAQMNAAAKNEGLKVYYKWESGKGKNQGTAEHIHGYALKNQRVAAGAEQRQEAVRVRQDISTDKLGLGVKNDALALRLRELGDATTQAMFDEGAKAAETALEEWAVQLKKVSEEEIVSGGLMLNEANDRRREVNNQITQKREDLVQRVAQKAEQFQKEVLQGIMKSLDNALDKAQQEFEERMRASQERVAVLQAQESGFDYASNAGKIPDFVRELAARRTAQAQEAEARMRSSQIPGLITAKNSALDTARGELDKAKLDKLPTGEIEAARLKVSELAAAVATLTAEKANLDTALASGGLVPTTLAEGLDQAIQAFREANNVGRTFKEEIIINMGQAINTMSEGFTNMFVNIATGAQSVLGAFKQFVTDMIKYMIQLAVRAAALKIFNLLLNAIGGSAAGGAGDTVSVTGNPVGTSAMFTGGTIGADGLVHLRSGGGRVTNGSPLKDSVNAKIAKNEWVVNSKAVESVGHPFMAKLNKEGAAALDTLQSAPVIVPQTPQETNVYVVKPDMPRQMGKNDVLVAIHEDILNGGETSKLIKHVSRS